LIEPTLETVLALLLADRDRQANASPAEVLVFSDQNALFGFCKLHQFGIDRALLVLADSKHIVSGGAKHANDRKITAFVCEKPQTPA
jgi:hypothetical protein